MAVKMKIRKGDQVVVLTGKDKGKTGAVIRVIPKDERVLVQGVNMVKRHTRADRASTGGIIDKEAPVHVSNVSATSLSSPRVRAKNRPRSASPGVPAK
jgi:large subunit ribosomal protein L24